MKNTLLCAALLAGAAPALAQTTRMLMPEGSKDVYLSLAAAIVPSAEGSAQQRLLVLPMVSAQWANGVFVNMNVIGVHLSDRSNVDYGFLLAPSLTRSSSTTADGRVSTLRLTPEAGAFVDYQVAYGMGLKSNLMYGGSIDHRGLRLNLNAYLSMPVAEHHALGLEGGIMLANRSALQANYGVTAAEASATLPVHEVGSGIRASTISATWEWEISNKFSLRSSIEAYRLRGSAARSPRIAQPGTLGMITVLTYRY